MIDKKMAYQQQRYADAKLVYDALMSCYPFTLDDLDGEQWRDIDGYDGRYQISNFGRVKSSKYKTPRIRKTQLTATGYLQVGLHKQNQMTLFYVHRLVAEMFIPSIEGKPQVNHIDGNKLNNHASNLEWCTVAENNQHSYDMGLNTSGGERTDAHLTNEQVEWCRLVYKPRDPNFGAKALAQKFGVQSNIVQYALRGQTYKNAGGPIHNKYGVPNNIRAEIKRLYIRDSREFGTPALAKKFGYSQSTVYAIVNEK